MAQQKREKPQAWKGQVVLARLEDWEKYDETSQERVRAAGRSTLQAMARQAGVHADSLGEVQEETTGKGTDEARRTLTLKGTVDRGRPPHAGN